MFCSQFVARMFATAGMKITDKNMKSDHMTLHEIKTLNSVIEDLLQTLIQLK